MTMRPVAGIDIPAAGEGALQPGSFQIMFTTLKRPDQGEKSEGTLTFEKEGTVKVELSVDAMGDGAGACEIMAADPRGRWRRVAGMPIY